MHKLNKKKPLQTQNKSTKGDILPATIPHESFSGSNNKKFNSGTHNFPLCPHNFNSKIHQSPHPLKKKQSINNTMYFQNENADTIIKPTLLDPFYLPPQLIPISPTKPSFNRKLPSHFKKQAGEVFEMPRTEDPEPELSKMDQLFNDTLSSTLEFTFRSKEYQMRGSANQCPIGPGKSLFKRNLKNQETDLSDSYIEEPKIVDKNLECVAKNVLGEHRIFFHLKN